MSHYDSSANQVIAWPDSPYPGFPGWTRTDCGCSGGLEWGGEEPRECRRCASGTLARHDRTGTLALWPGGPLRGRESRGPESMGRLHVPVIH